MNAMKPLVMGRTWIYIPAIRAVHVDVGAPAIAVAPLPLRLAQRVSTKRQGPSSYRSRLNR